jgi:hypothetical protein
MICWKYAFGFPQNTTNLAAAMPFTPRTIETRCASMRLVAPGFIEQRFRADATLNIAGFEENRVARHDLGSNMPYVMLTFIPEGIDFDLQVTSTDHFKPERGTNQMRALAVVVSDGMGEAIAKLYFSYFPTEFPARVFHEERAAREWLADAQSATQAEAV